MTQTSFLSALTATRTSTPDSPRLPFLHGLDGWDLLGVIAVVVAFTFLWGLFEERSRSRRRRADYDIDRVIEMRRTLTGWQPPEQRHARPKQDAA